MASDELKPCPFCGEEAEIERIGTSRFSTVYSCTSCGCSLETGETFNHGAAWNRRAQDFDAMRQRVELLEGLLTEVRQRCPLPDWARSRIDTALSTWRQAHTPSTLPASSAEE